MTLPPPGTLDLGAARKAEEMVWMDSSANSTGRVSISIYLYLEATRKAEEMVCWIAQLILQVLSPYLSIYLSVSGGYQESGGWMDSLANCTGTVTISIYLYLVAAIYLSIYPRWWRRR